MAAEYTITDDYRRIYGAGFAHLGIFDPPWNQTSLGFDNEGFDLDECAVRLSQQLRPDGWLFMFGTVEMAAVMMKYFRFKFDYIWKKPTGPPLRKTTVAPMRIHETIYAFCQKDLKRMGDLYMDREALKTEGKPYVATSNNKSEYDQSYGHLRHQTVNTGYRYGVSVLEFNSKNAGMPWHERTEHPTQKPLDLIRLLIRGYCPRGGHVLDPTLGSGTTLIAAVKEGRSCTGAEIDPKYRAIIQRRHDLLKPGSGMTKFDKVAA